MKTCQTMWEFYWLVGKKPLSQNPKWNINFSILNMDIKNEKQTSLFLG